MRPFASASVRDNAATRQRFGVVSEIIRERFSREPLGLRLGVAGRELRC